MISHPYQANLPKEKWDRLFCTKHSTSLLNATRSWGNLLLVLLRSLKAWPLLPSPHHVRESWQEVLSQIFAESSGSVSPDDIACVMSKTFALAAKWLPRWDLFQLRDRNVDRCLDGMGHLRP